MIFRSPRPDIGIPARSRIGFVLRAALLLAATGLAGAAPRQTTSLDAWWRFAREDLAEAHQPGFDDSPWFEVTLPHTFNGGDGEDGGGYSRGAAWSRRTLLRDEPLRG